jgi:hypothetical protein
MSEGERISSRVIEGRWHQTLGTSTRVCSRSQMNLEDCRALSEAVVSTLCTSQWSLPCLPAWSAQRKNLIESFFRASHIPPITLCEGIVSSRQNNALPRQCLKIYGALHYPSSRYNLDFHVPAFQPVAHFLEPCIWSRDSRAGRLKQLGWSTPRSWNNASPLNHIKHKYFVCAAETHLLAFKFWGRLLCGSNP